MHVPTETVHVLRNILIKWIDTPLKYLFIVFERVLFKQSCKEYNSEVGLVRY